MTIPLFISPRVRPGTPIQGRQSRRAQLGASLIMVLLVLVIVSILGVAAAQLGLMGERGARNDRDLQMALQASTIALHDAEEDIFSATTRPNVFRPDNELEFLEGCGDKGMSKGLCMASANPAKPVWLTVDLEGATRTTLFGERTQRSFSASADGKAIGVQPAKAPRYVIERLPPDAEQGGDLAVEAGRPPLTSAVLYRVTAMGFGPRDDILAVTQTIIRKL